MKYSLRSLMIVVTLACIVLGGVMSRVEYLRRWAAFHEVKARHYQERAEREKEQIEKDASQDWLATHEFLASAETYRAIVYHENMAVAFRQAVYRPWMPFAEPQECTELRRNHPELNP
jgi:hypothetical protein